MSLVVNQFLFEFAGIPVELSTNSSTIEESLSHYWIPFVTASSPQVKIYLEHLPDGSQWTGEPFDLKWHDQGFDALGSGMELHYNHTKEEAHLILKLESGAGDILRMFYSLLLVKKGGALLHAAALTKGKTASIFSAPSGTGKTTLCKMKQDRHLLTDEAVALFPLNGKTLASSTPFFGGLYQETQNLTLPVSFLFFLAQGKDFKVTSFSSVQTLEHLIRNIFIVTRSRDFMQQLMDNFYTMISTFDSYQLYSLPEERVWDFLNKEVSDEV